MYSYSLTGCSLTKLAGVFLIFLIGHAVQKVICFLYKSLKTRDKRNNSEEDGLCFHNEGKAISVIAIFFVKYFRQIHTR